MSDNKPGHVLIDGHPVRERQFWLVTLDQYGNPTKADGMHTTREGVEKALYLHSRLGFAKGKRYACAEMVITELKPKSHGSNETELTQLNKIGLHP